MSNTKTIQELQADVRHLTEQVKKLLMQNNLLKRQLMKQDNIEETMRKAAELFAKFKPPSQV